MPLRVAIVALYPAPGAGSAGGVRAVVQNLVRGLSAHTDLSLHVIHCHGDIPRSDRITEGHVDVRYIAMPRRRLVPNSLLSIVRVREALGQVRPDVVNAHAAHYALAGVLARVPTILTIHGVVQREAEVYSSTHFDRIRFWLERRLEELALAQVGDVVAISPYVVREYEGRTRARMHRIDNPLPPEWFEVADDGEDDRLLYAGTIDERKNVLDLVQAVSLLREEVPGVRLAIAGRTTQPAYDSQVRRLVSQLDLEGHVEFLGLLSVEQMRSQYGRSRAVVLASRQETAPMSVMEAMACGKAVVATDVGGVPHLVEDGSSGFVVPVGDVLALARRMEQVLNNRELALAMGARGRILARRFAAASVAAEYRALYYDAARRSMP